MDQSSASTSTVHDDKDEQSAWMPEPLQQARRGRRDRIKAAMTKVMKQAVDAQSANDRMFLDLEEKRMKFQAEQRQEERELQLRMMSMPFSSHSPHSALSGSLNTFSGMAGTTAYDTVASQNSASDSYGPAYKPF